NISHNIHSAQSVTRLTVPLTVVETIWVNVAVPPPATMNITHLKVGSAPPINDATRIIPAPMASGVASTFTMLSMTGMTEEANSKITANDTAIVAEVEPSQSKFSANVT